MDDLIEKFITGSPENARLLSVEGTVLDVGEAIYKRMGEFNWGYKRLSRRLGMKRRECKRLIKKENYTLRELCNILYALELKLVIVEKEVKITGYADIKEG